MPPKNHQQTSPPGRVILYVIKLKPLIHTANKSEREDMGEPRVIRPGDNLLLRLPNGELKLVKISEGDGRGLVHVIQSILQT
jgi:hypothetical protein